MNRTDYEQVAAVYDQNPTRLYQPADDVIPDLLRARGEVAVLDVGCGTGNWLTAQVAAFQSRPIRWHGVDPSPAMLERAHTKLPSAELRLGRAEALTYPAAAFDYVYSSFAFHHFEDKPRALDELLRVLKPSGMLRIVNVDPFKTPLWWPCVFFPETVAIDQARHWPSERLCSDLEARGFEVTLHLVYDRLSTTIAHVLAEAERRDLSQLAILDDSAYQRGLERLRALDPAKRVPNESAVFTCTARQGSA
jgi:ubiquinone/menaquinone biosynthesis C-methylase UbiE